MIFTNKKSAKQAKKISKAEGLGLKYSHIIIVTNKINKGCNNFQYIPKRPISKNILMDIFKHIIHGEILRSEDPHVFTQSPETVVQTGKLTPIRTCLSILVVDDDELVRNCVVRQLKSLIGKVEGYGTPSKALEQYKASPKQYDAIFVDYQMPEMNGLELAGEIRKYEKMSGIAASGVYIVCMICETE